MTLTNSGIKGKLFQPSSNTIKGPTDQFSTSLAFWGAQNLIRWAAEIAGQLLSFSGVSIQIAWLV